ncbi:V-type ATP synthase subunit I [Candidatus Bipolaricaulota sp. J31]
MLITEKMYRVHLFLPKEDLTTFWEVLGRFGEMQPEGVQRIEALRERLRFVELGPLLSRLREAASILKVDLEEPLSDPGISPLSPDELARRLDPLYEELHEVREKERSLQERRRALERELEHLQIQEAHLQLLSPLEVDIGGLFGLKRFAVLAGTMPDYRFQALERGLHRYPHLLLPYRRHRHRVQLLVVCLREDLDEVRQVLETALFRPLDLPEELRGRPQEAMEVLEERRDELLHELEEVRAEEARFEESRRDKAREFGDFLKVNAAVLEARGLAGETREVAVVTGWVPKRALEELQQAVRHKPEWVLEAREVPYRMATDRDGLPVPTELRNPRPLKPFEALVRLYGLPRYGGFDPTLLFSLLFVGLFGMMFGDLGHGLVLFLVGLLLRMLPVRQGLSRTGGLLVPVGLSSMIFGVLYGSVFGYEDIIPALWFHPMDAIDRLLVYAISIGAGVIVVGIVANIVAKLIQARLDELLWERFGILGLWFYLGGLLLLGMSRGFSAWRIGLVFAPLILMAGGKLIVELRKARAEGSSRGFVFLIGAVDLFETFIVYFSNTLSFIRVAAFALNHVALSLAIFQVADMLRGLPGGGIISGVLVAGGNLLILVLEGGIVAIQVLRLEFYEFFSKFFETEGVPFRPFRLRIQRGKEVSHA